MQNFHIFGEEKSVGTRQKLASYSSFRTASLENFKDLLSEMAHHYWKL